MPRRQAQTRCRRSSESGSCSCLPSQSNSALEFPGNVANFAPDMGKIPIFIRVRHECSRSPVKAVKRIRPTISFFEVVVCHLGLLETIGQLHIAKGHEVGTF